MAEIPIISWSNYKLLPEQLWGGNIPDEKDNQSHRILESGQLLQMGLRADYVRVGIVHAQEVTPDGMSPVDIYYSVNKLSFSSYEEGRFATTISCIYDESMELLFESSFGVSVKRIGPSTWQILRLPTIRRDPEVSCRLVKDGQPDLCLRLHIFFEDDPLAIEGEKIVAIPSEYYPYTDMYQKGVDLYVIPTNDVISNSLVTPLERLSDTSWAFPYKIREKGVLVFSMHGCIVPMACGHGGDLDWETELLQEENLSGTYWNSVNYFFWLCAEHDLPFSAFSSIRAVMGSNKLLSKFVLSFWIDTFSWGGNIEVFKRYISEFEKKMHIRLSSIPQYMLENTIAEYPETLTASEKSEFFRAISRP